MKVLEAVVAWDLKGGIGFQGGLPWPNVSEDMRRFRELTTGHTVLMGRKTADSLHSSFRPLPKRRNLVLSRDLTYAPTGFEVVRDWADLSKHVSDDEKVFVIGGAEIFRLALPLIGLIHVTEMVGTFRADTFFPGLNLGEWRLRGEPTFYSTGELASFPIRFYQLERKNHS